MSGVFCDGSNQKDLDERYTCFPEQDHISPPYECKHVSFHGRDKLKILNSPPENLVTEIIQTSITDIQRYEVTIERTEIRFNGSPWRSTVHAGVHTQLKLLVIPKVIERHGFMLYARIGAWYSDETSPSNVLVFQRRHGWVPRAPNWHN